MFLRQLSLLIFCVCALSACGGGSDSKSGGANSSSSWQSRSSSLQSSSASVLSSSAIASSQDADVIFSDSLNSQWGAFKNYEYVFNSYASYGEGEQGFFLKWQTVPAADTARNEVLELNFIETLRRGWTKFQVASSVARDLSVYETGTLSFDINVLEWPRITAFSVYVECGWPCGSHAYVFQVKGLNSWTHIEIPVADMILDGLDITAVDKPFVLFPQRDPEHYIQEGIRVQLDNIKWTKGTTPAVRENVIYAEHFNENIGQGKWNPVPYKGDTGVLRSSVDRDGLVIGLFGVIPFYSDWAIETNLDSPIDLTHKKISFQLLPHSFAMGEALVRFVAVDGQGKEAVTADIGWNSLVSDSWNRLSFNVDDAAHFSVEAGFNLQDVRKLAIRFDGSHTMYIVRGDSATLRVDEIIISE